MKQDLISVLQLKLQQNQNLSESDRFALLQLLAEFKQQIDLLNTSHPQAAADILATPPSVQKIRTAVDEFEVTHPQLVDVVNRLCVMLANLGI